MDVKLSIAERDEKSYKNTKFGSFARSPDLSPGNFCSLGSGKQVHKSNIKALRDLQLQVQRAFEHIPHVRGVMEDVP